MKHTNKVYDLYVSDLAVELPDNEKTDFGEARFVCSQVNYKNILEFAINLAKSKQLTFQNYIQPEERN
jgi:hypothetical protein